MKPYRIILGEPLSKKFDKEFKNWEETLDFIIVSTDFDSKELIDSWTPQKATFRELVEFLISRIWKFGFLVKFVVDYTEDPYGKTSENPRMYLISQSDYLKTKNALWVVENREIFEGLLLKENMNSITYLVHDYNERYKRQ